MFLRRKVVTRGSYVTFYINNSVKTHKEMKEESKECIGRFSEENQKKFIQILQLCCPWTNVNVE
jgi:hypothetical protein